VSVARLGAFFLGALCVAATLEAQRPVLRYGLRAGRRDVAVRAVAGDRSLNVWHPASCGRRPANPATPCPDAAPDSGRFPLLLLGSTGRSLLDSVRAGYFASHGYAVVVVSAGFDDAWRGARGLPFVDSSRVAVIAVGAAVTAARMFVSGVDAVDALALLDADSGDAVVGIGGRFPVLSWRAPGSAPAPAGAHRFAVQLPPGPADHLRLVTAVTHAFLDAALGRGALTLTDLTDRLRAAGLIVWCARLC